MNDNSSNEVPGTEEEALAQIREVLDGWLIICQIEGQQPVVSAANLFAALYDSLDGAMGRAAIRMALLMCYERSFEAGMSIDERAQTMRLLDQVVAARRQVEGKPTLILPGFKGDA